jgi:hypothetical protein
MRLAFIAAVAIFLSSCDERSERKAKNGNSNVCKESLEGRTWAYMRLGVRYMISRDFSNANASLIALIQERVFPIVSEFWSHAISVRSLQRPLTVERKCKMKDGKCVKEIPSVCSSRNGHKVRIPRDLLGELLIYNGDQAHRLSAGPGEEVDFMVLVSVDDHESCGDTNGGTIATAYACRWDECDRPLMGAVNICPRAVDPRSERSIQSLFSTLAHEMTHVFGFSSDNFQYMRHILGSPRISPKNRKSVLYTCAIKDGVPQVIWDASPKIAKGNLYKYTFPVGIIEGGSARGVGGSQCRCPFDPNRTYTSDDISHCLMHRDECIFIVKTPRVAAISRLYFGCPTIAGAELENQRKEISCQILDSHWKQRLFGEEYMTSIAARTHGEVSPVTFAFLEDTGWYRMNYAMTTALVPGAHFGFKAGCDFVNNKCIEENQVVAKTDFNPKTFCTKSGVVCSADGTHKVDCNIRHSPMGTDVPGAYRYPLAGRSRMDDYCPIYGAISETDCSDVAEQADWPWELRGKGSRCLDALNTDGSVRASCINLVCYENGTEYEISVRDNRGNSLPIKDRCKSADQRIAYDNMEFVCIDPVIICSIRDYAHVGYIDIVPSIPGAVVNDASRLEAQQVSNKIYSDRSGPVYYKPGRR